MFSMFLVLPLQLASNLQKLVFTKFVVLKYLIEILSWKIFSKRGIL